MDLLVQQPEHARDGRPADVDVQQSNLQSARGQGKGQLCGESALPHPALPGQDENLVLDLRQPV